MIMTISPNPFPVITIKKGKKQCGNVRPTTCLDGLTSESEMVDIQVLYLVLKVLEQSVISLPLLRMYLKSIIAF